MRTLSTDKSRQPLAQRNTGQTFRGPVACNTNDSAAKNGLPTTLRKTLENGMGHSFSQVEIHEQSSRAVQLNAEAFAQGNEIHFAPGQYRPDSKAGQQLIGHELAHIVQQRKGVVKPEYSIGADRFNDERVHESNADQMATKALAGEIQNHVMSSATSGKGVIQRKLKVSGSGAHKTTLLNKINAGTLPQFKYGAGSMLEAVPPIPTPLTRQFPKSIIAGIGTPNTIELRLVSRPNLMLDSAKSGEINVIDLFGMTPDIFKASLVHILEERKAIPNYEVAKATLTETGPTYQAAHRAGLLAEASYWQQKYPRKSIRFISEGQDNSTAVVDAAGNGTVDFVIDFNDIHFIMTVKVVGGTATGPMISNRVKIIR